MEFQELLEHIIIFIIHSWKNVLCKKNYIQMYYFDNRYAQKKQNILERLLIKCYYGVIVVIIFVSRKINEI